MFFTRNNVRRAVAALLRDDEEGGALDDLATALAGELPAPSGDALTALATALGITNEDGMLTAPNVRLDPFVGPRLKSDPFVLRVNGVRTIGPTLTGGGLPSDYEFVVPAGKWRGELLCIEVEFADGLPFTTYNKVNDEDPADAAGWDTLAEARAALPEVDEGKINWCKIFVHANTEWTQNTSSFLVGDGEVLDVVIEDGTVLPAVL